VKGPTGPQRGRGSPVGVRESAEPPRGPGQEREEEQQHGEQLHGTPWHESNHLNHKSLAHFGTDVKVARPMV
jgi:hypothetical protein